jgi:hypothetical protein
MSGKTWLRNKYVWVIILPSTGQELITFRNKYPAEAWASKHSKIYLEDLQIEKRVDETEK